MKEYIEREAARLAYEMSLKNNNHIVEGASAIHVQEHRHILHVLNKIPAADVVEVVHARWRLNTDGSGTCGNCGRTQKAVWDFDNCQRYCGCCGAKMDEGGTEE